MSKRPRYTDEFRANVVLMLEAAGYTGDKETSKDGSLSAVSRRTDVPLSTLRRWFIKQQNPPPAELVNKKRIDFEQAITAEMSAILEEMGSAREDAPYNHLATAFGILFDKYQLLTGGATANENKQVLIKYAD